MGGNQLDLLGRPALPPAASGQDGSTSTTAPPTTDATAGDSPPADVPPAPATPARRARRSPKAHADAAPASRPPVSSAPEPSGERPTLYLVDGPNLAFRAHFAQMPPLANSAGFPTKALFGYTAQLLSLIRERRPDMLAIAWDPGGPTFRTEMFPDYKGTRPDMPAELRMQMPRFAEVASALGLRHVSVPGFEADDVIGTLAVRFAPTCDVTIVSSDKDLMQLVADSRITVLDVGKGQRLGPAQVQEKWGVPPGRIVDLLALMGDSSDNIPGVEGIGQKGAADLAGLYGSIEDLFDHAAEVQGRNRKPLLAEGARASALLSRDLATLRLDVDVPLAGADMDLRFPPADPGPATALFQELEFHRFLADLGGEMRSIEGGGYKLVTDILGLRALIGRLADREEIGLEVIASSGDANRADLLGLSFCVDEAEAWYVPLFHRGPGTEGLVPPGRALLYLRAILESPAHLFVGGDLQFAATVLARHGVALAGPAADASVASFLLNSERKTHDLPGLALTWLRHKVVEVDPIRQAAGGDLAAAPLGEAARFGPEPAHVAWLLRPLLDRALAEGGLDDVYRRIDLPLVPVLSRMQRHGIRLDTEKLAKYREELALAVAEAERLTWQHAGREFNSGSPKQLAEILFVELELPVTRRTKTGPSTDASVLEELADLHPLPAAILHYRTLSKLLSTYVDALPPLVDPTTGRVHTHYSQTVAATGRLSSFDPNLQNIPIRTAEGRRIREAFVPDPGCVFLSADYSQVELRVLAHLCREEGGFARAFLSGQDVHRATAAEVFGTSPGQVTPEMRTTAKAVNFGLVYGQTDYGLARTLHIGRTEAKDYIARFKERFPEIDRFVEDTVAAAAKDRFVRTVTGRRRPVADLTSSSFNARQAARRVAVNTPVQGSAADIIKLAMLALDRILGEEFREVRMLLQVHDELVFEVPEGQVDRLRRRVVEAMESAYPLRVPLRVDTGTGHNWDEAH